MKTTVVIVFLTFVLAFMNKDKLQNFQLMQLVGESPVTVIVPVDDSPIQPPIFIPAQYLRSRFDPFNPSTLTCLIDNHKNLFCEGLAAPDNVNKTKLPKGLKTDHFGYRKKTRLNPEGTLVSHVEIDKLFGITFLTTDGQVYFVGHTSVPSQTAESPTKSLILRQFQPAQKISFESKLSRLKSGMMMSESGELFSHKWAYLRIENPDCHMDRKLGLTRIGRPNRGFEPTCQPPDLLVFPDLGPFRDWSDNDGASCVVSLKGEVFCWGQNEFGQIGVEGHGKTQLIPQRVSLSAPVLTIITTLEQTCAATKDQQTYCWGMAPQEEYRRPRIKLANTEIFFYPRPVLVEAVQGLRVARFEADDTRTICLQTDETPMRIFCRGNFSKKFYIPRFREIRPPANTQHILLGRTMSEEYPYCFIKTSGPIECTQRLMPAQ